MASCWPFAVAAALTRLSIVSSQLLSRGGLDVCQCISAASVNVRLAIGLCVAYFGQTYCVDNTWSS